MDLRNGDCLEILKELPNKSVDLVFADLPYGQVNCKWDCKIDLELLWKELLRVAKTDATPFFFTCTTKFGYELISSNKKMFRYDLVWAKSNPCGFLQAKKQPMRKHEMLYVFYKKQPAYDISSHKHKFKKEEPVEDVDLDSKVYGTKDRKKPLKNMGPNTGNLGYDPPLPVSVIKEPDCYNFTNRVNEGKLVQPYTSQERSSNVYDPPLPVSVIKEEEHTTESSRGEKTYGKYSEKANREAQLKIYDPPLPVSVIKDEGCYGTDEEYRSDYYDEATYGKKGRSQVLYEPPLPHSLLEIKSIRLKQHSTAKPPDLMKWILKYYTKEGDTILDPTMGSNPMGLACKEMNRDYIGIEKDPEIYAFACKRVE